MTTTECVASLSARGPYRAYCATKDAWAHKCGETSVTYRVAAVPGIGGQECSAWTGKTLEEAHAQAVAALFPQANDTNNE